ncbi:MAG: hypothetical protein Tsb0020_24890 [Haliangiales bacterium]
MRDKVSSLTISLQYADEDCGSWSLYDLCHNQGVLNPEHMSNDGFHQALGGPKLYEDRIFCFLNSEGWTDLFSNAWFLLQSVVVLSDKPEARELEHLFFLDDDHRTVAHLDHEDGSSLHLSRTADDSVLSFRDPRGESPARRLSPYFANLSIAKDAWLASAAEALTEYALLARRVCGPHDAPQTGPGQIRALWSALNLSDPD